MCFSLRRLIPVVFGIFLLGLFAGIGQPLAPAHPRLDGTWMAGTPGCGGQWDWKQHPHGFALTCDPIAWVEKAEWKGWGSDRARAEAVLNSAALNGHNSVESAPRRHYAATVIASDVVQCHARRVYNSVVVHYRIPGKPGKRKTLGPTPLCSSPPPPKTGKQAEFRTSPSGVACGIFDGESGVVPGAKCTTGGSPAAAEVGTVYVAQIGAGGGVNRCSEPLHDPEDLCEWGNLGEGTPTYQPGKQVRVGRFSCKVLEEGVECTVIASGKGFLITPEGIAAVGS